jgi:hypothetical protein
MRIDWNRPSSSFLLTTLTHRQPPSAQPIGSETSVHFSETCDEDSPRLITQVTTTIAPIPDRHALPDIHTNLEQRELLPEQHLVDAGYTDAEALVAAQNTYQVDLVGPTAQDYRGPGTRTERVCVNRFHD